MEMETEMEMDMEMEMVMEMQMEVQMQMQIHMEMEMGMEMVEMVEMVILKLRREVRSSDLHRSGSRHRAPSHLMLFASPRDDVLCQTHGEGAKSKPRPVLEKRRRPTCQSTRCSRLEPDGRKSRSLSRNRTLRNNALVAGSGTINEADSAEVPVVKTTVGNRDGNNAPSPRR